MTHFTQGSPAAHAGGARDTRNLLPLWRIRGTITLTTPLSIGSGRDEPISIQEKGDQNHDRFVIAVVRDHLNRPYIPGGSIKGALNALARESDMSTAIRSSLFGAGAEEGTKTRPGLIEFCNLWRIGDLPDSSDLPNWDGQGHTANLPHGVQNRDYGTSEDGLLFLEQVVPPGSTFAFECTARAAEESAIQALLGLLALAGNQDSPLRLGGGKAMDNGRISWQQGELRRLDDLAVFWNTLAAPGASTGLDLWTDPCSRPVALDPTPVALAGPSWMILSGLQLAFHTPFLVYQHQPKQAGNTTPAGVPRCDHHGHAALPASSLHGALRAQAERILRTVGIKTPKGYKLPAGAAVGDAGKCDLASVLFGAPGWRSLIRLSDFTVQGQERPLIHEMVAIDRLTGGSKDSAKFNIRALDCPTLAGNLSVDLRRLGLLDSGVAARVLGLLAHVMRDLDEGDIPLGYGAAKGYGRSRSATCAALAARTDQMKPAGVDSLDMALRAFSDVAKAAPTSAVLGAGMKDEPAAPAANKSNGDFHNPYVFIPFGEPRREDDRLPWVEHAAISEIENTHHSHARYAPGAFNGRLVCRLRTVTPIFIGAGNIEGTRENFRLNGEIALPATSLRGMLSTLHESITRSALRVMDDRHYSVRAAPNQLPSKGEIVQRPHPRKDGTIAMVWKVYDVKTHTEYVIPPSVLKRLQCLCDERTEETSTRTEVLPLVRPAEKRNKNPARDGQKLRLVVGQTVYFALDGNQITEMAYSQIWRKMVSLSGSEAPWLASNALPDVELASLSPRRDSLSPSELLFGYVELPSAAATPQTQAKAALRAFATKVHIGYGYTCGTPELQEAVTLKILSSPKPPSPAMYFRERDGNPCHVSKTQFADNPAAYELKGRKTYLHALRRDNTVQALDDMGNEAGNRMPWQSARPTEMTQQKARVRPIAADTEFLFDVDFVNLSQAELESLCACLVPHSSFEHKLGMGKPIGLGSVKIEIAGLYLVDRAARYRQTDFAAARRYATVWKDKDAALPEHLEHLRLERASLDTADATDPKALAWTQMAKLREDDPAVFNAIVLTGDPKAVHKPVHYPQLKDMDIEQETFEWFVDNEGRGKNYKGKPQPLQPFDKKSNSLPVLSRTKRKIEEAASPYPQRKR